MLSQMLSIFAVGCVALVRFSDAGLMNPEIRQTTRASRRSDSWIFIGVCASISYNCVHTKPL
jgi:hypothetical protein